jgi:hypothetical protein
MFHGRDGIASDGTHSLYSCKNRHSFLFFLLLFSLNALQWQRCSAEMPRAVDRVLRHVTSTVASAISFSREKGGFASCAKMHELRPIAFSP